MTCCDSVRESWLEYHKEQIDLERISLKGRVDIAIGHELRECLIALSMDTPDIDIATNMIKRAIQQLDNL